MAEQIREMAKAFAKRIHAAGEAGATAVEYGLIVALIAAAIIVGVNTLSTATEKCYTDVATAIGSGTEDKGC